jgi:hypothetical protein
MTKHRISIGVFLLAAAQGCDAAEMGADEESLEPAQMLSAAGVPDVDHGTGKYESPVRAVDDELGQRIFVALLTGGQEVPAVAGKRQGAMALILNRERTRLRFVLQHDVDGATVAHLHAAAAGENGPVVVGLPSADRHSAGAVAVTPEQVRDLIAGRLYVNVHSGKNPTGEIRGQILRPGETLFVAALEGTQEVPPIASKATAVASVILGAARNQIRYRISMKDVAPTVAHLHRGIAGVNGPVVYPLAPVGAVIEGIQPVNPADVQDLARRRWYVNIHSAANPTGELRGQLLRPGEAVFAAKLTGAQEVPANASTASGNAMVVLGSAGGKFLYVVETTASPTAAHIHRAPGGVNGPVEVELGPLGPSSTPITGVSALGAERAADVARGLWYVNVHSATNPTGELRGQLLRPGETLYTALLDGASEVPAVETRATAGFAAILNAPRSELRYEGVVAGLTPTVGHIHAGPVGVSGPVALPLTLTLAGISGTQTVGAADLAALDAAGYYVNLHSALHPTGEVRGQLIRR